MYGYLLTCLPTHCLREINYLTIGKPLSFILVTGLLSNYKFHRAREPASSASCQIMYLSLARRVVNTRGRCGASIRASLSVWQMNLFGAPFSPYPKPVPLPAVSVSIYIYMHIINVYCVCLFILLARGWWHRLIEPKR